MQHSSIVTDTVKIKPDKFILQNKTIQQCPDDRLATSRRAKVTRRIE